MFVRTDVSAAIVETNEEERNKYRQQRQLLLDVKFLKEEVETLKLELLEINNLLSVILEKK